MIRKTDLGVQRTNEIQPVVLALLRTDDSGVLSTGYHQDNNYYRRGDVRISRSIGSALKSILPTFDPKKWDESHVHTAIDFGVEDFFKNVQPVIVFDKDLDKTREDDLLGYSVDALSTDDELKRQVRTGTDYLGMFSFLKSWALTPPGPTRSLRPSRMLTGSSTRRPAMTPSRPRWLR